MAPSVIYTNNTLRRLVFRFFETNEGHPHIGRICALIYTVALVPGCESFVRIDPLCIMRIVFASGWWLALGQKKPARTFADIAYPLGFVGMFLLCVGLAGQFYFTRRH